ncbi:MAG TPA: glutamate-5-semialdehyde dehydrogenase, partial [Saprospiraceae bacterium]|nr:glutamate-5-semialdehyde dehydrogenase [Saprospiraceae bacterium]
FINVRQAAKLLAKSNNILRNEVLKRIAKSLNINKDLIITQNQRDLQQMADVDPKKDRLLLNAARIDNLVSSINEIISFNAPDQIILSSKKLDNGLKIEKITVPMGVVAAVYESRPNVTIDIAAMCIKSGNACILRGGTDAFHTNTMLVQLKNEVLQSLDLPTAAITLYPTERDLMPALLNAERYVDLVIPRGSAALIDFVRNNCKIPTIETGAGVCHTYVSPYADINKAVDIVTNAKVSRPSVCNSLDCIILHQSTIQNFLPKIVKSFLPYKVGIYADEVTYPIIIELGYPYINHAEEDDFGREFLDFKCSIKTVDSLDKALDHIERYSSRHSECIVSENEDECTIFIDNVDAAAVYANASTRFTDGGVYGLGAEIGISTQKLHARGPFGLEKLVTEKWIGRGNGQVR